MSAPDDVEVDTQRIKRLQTATRATIVKTQNDPERALDTLRLAYFTYNLLSDVQRLNGATSEQVDTEYSGIADRAYQAAVEIPKEDLQQRWERAAGMRDPKKYLENCFPGAMVWDKPRIDGNALLSAWTARARAQVASPAARST